MKKTTKWVLLGVGGFMLLGTIQEVNKSRGEPLTNSEQEKVLGEENTDNYMSATTIMEDYKENEFTANKKYKGKTILVYGVSSRIQLDFSDDPFITLGDEGLRSVHCEINKGDKSLETIREGNTVYLVCEGAGEVASSPMLKKCRVTQIQ